MLQPTSISCKCCTLQDAGLGQESFKCEKLCQPHRTGPQQEQRDCFLRSFSPDRTRGRRDRNVCQTSTCPECGTHLPVGSRLTPFRDLGSLGWLPKPHNHWRHILGLSKPNLSETIRTILQQWEWVTSLDFKDAYFHILIQEQSRTYQISCPGSDIPVQSTVFRSVHCTHGAHCSSKGVETDGHTQGYNNPPVLRSLVGESHIPPGVSLAYTRSSENMPNFRLPVRPHGQSGMTYTGPLAEPSGQNTRNTVTTGLSGPVVHV